MLFHRFHYLDRWYIRQLYRGPLSLPVHKQFTAKAFHNNRRSGSRTKKKSPPTKDEGEAFNDQGRRRSLQQPRTKKKPSTTKDEEETSTSLQERRKEVVVTSLEKSAMLKVAEERCGHESQLEKVLTVMVCVSNEIKM
ncbi:unnamed protein product [Strongylus vulgaris]|uniref:Uncharacterized protein n=1 Tax=Strongylus vulgaris TaxID=40348 RepID=A0A3P7JEW6_STRVU|nr:unnamed protein product [Strongylus vulgaris]